MKKITQSLLLTLCALAIIGTAFYAVAAERDTPERSGEYLAITAGAAIDQGNMVCILSSDGLAYTAADTASYSALGRAEKTVAIGETAIIKRGTFRWANQGVFTDANINDICYIWTNGSYSVTTAAIASNDIKAGRIIDVDTSGVWVEMSSEPLVTSTPSSLAVAGAATVGTTLGVAGASTLTGAAALGSTLAVTGASTLTGAAALGSTLAVTGATTLTGALVANGAVTFTNGVIKLTGLPTSTNDLATGTLWDSSGTLSVIQ